MKEKDFLEKAFLDKVISGSKLDNEHQKTENLNTGNQDTEYQEEKLLDMSVLKAETEKIIMEYMPVLGEYNEPVTSAMHYSITAGGKRLRPILIYLTFKAFGGAGDTVLPYMAAIEMIHTYSLIHDDLPALDNDDLRRGRKTCHVVYGEDMAILAGDSLLNLGFETAAKAFLIEPGSINLEKALIIFMQKAGINGMAGGQVRDVYLTGKPVSPEELLYIYENKTAALIEASMMIGAYLAGASDDEVEKIKKIASNVGLAFQVQDDILDITSSSEVLGKPVGSDEKNEKYTYATIYGLEAARTYVKEKTEEAVEMLEGLFVDDNIFYKTLKELLISLIDRDR